jgi:hypothetical protein
VRHFQLRLLALVLILAEKVFSIPKLEDLLAPVVIFTSARFAGVVITGEISQMELREGQQVPLTAALRTRAGRPAAYEQGSATWGSSDPSIATVTVDPNNELVATVVGVSSVGSDGQDNPSAVITFRADGDPDADQTRDLIGTLDVVVTQGEAVVVELSAGAPTDVPTASDGGTASSSA